MSSVQLISASQFVSILSDSSERSKYQVVDVREQNEIDQLPIPTSNFFHFPTSLSSEWSELKVENPPKLRRDVPVIVCCRSGKRGGTFADYLVNEASFSNVYNVEGGMLAVSELKK
jgi:rhodanese-related sulfurtransferase